MNTSPQKKNKKTTVTKRTERKEKLRAEILLGRATPCCGRVKMKGLWCIIQFFLSLPPFVPLAGSRLTDEISRLWGVAPVAFSLKKTQRSRFDVWEKQPLLSLLSFTQSAVCRKADQYYILALEKMPEETQAQTFRLSEHQNTPLFHLYPPSGKSMGGGILNGADLFKKRAEGSSIYNSCSTWNLDDRKPRTGDSLHTLNTDSITELLSADWSGADEFSRTAALTLAQNRINGIISMVTAGLQGHVQGIDAPLTVYWLLRYRGLE